MRKVVRQLPRIRDAICTAKRMYLESATDKIRAKGANSFHTLRTSNVHNRGQIIFREWTKHDRSFYDNYRLANSLATTSHVPVIPRNGKNKLYQLKMKILKILKILGGYIEMKWDGILSNGNENKVTSSSRFNLDCEILQRKAGGASNFYIRSLKKDREYSDILRFGDILLRKYAPAGNVPSHMMTKACTSVGQWVARQKYSAPPVTPAFNRSSFFAGE